MAWLDRYFPQRATLPALRPPLQHWIGQHLAHVFVKPGVETRSAAMALAAGGWRLAAGK